MSESSTEKDLKVIFEERIRAQICILRAEIKGTKRGEQKEGDVTFISEKEKGECNGGEIWIKIDKLNSLVNLYSQINESQSVDDIEDFLIKASLSPTLCKGIFSRSEKLIKGLIKEVEKYKEEQKEDPAQEPPGTSL